MSDRSIQRKEDYLDWMCEKFCASSRVYVSAAAAAAAAVTSPPTAPSASALSRPLKGVRSDGNADRILRIIMESDQRSVIAETEQDLQRRWIIWQKTMEAKGLKVNTGKTEVMVSGKGDERIVIRDKEGETLNQVQKFKYLGLMFGEKGGSMLAVRARVKASWEKWREIGPVIGDKKMPRKLKTKLYTTMVRPVILYGAECWVVGQKEEQLLETTEMRMLRRIREVTLEDKMRSDDIRKELGVCPIGEKARESRLRWFGHVMRREPENHLKQMLNLEVPGRRPRGRPKGRWRDGITRDMKQLHIEAEDAEDRSFWRKRTQAADLNLGTGASRQAGRQIRDPLQDSYRHSLDSGEMSPSQRLNIFCIIRTGSNLDSTEGRHLHTLKCRSWPLRLAVLDSSSIRHAVAVTLPDCSGIDILEVNGDNMEVKGALVALWIESQPLDLQGLFCCGFEPRDPHPSLTEGLKA
ncbi:hypothetical protein PoB_003020300 [Plakobranchus ocellatus]|uniref:Reverse transcriptase domain-containing protein n=2 Tax=Plakobranchus ocellatus TaxID=259542 RepID=A0AAV4A8Z0_9GAST|nr:hypothetical protein PoB_003020300 [Plakobranchus ocellatus]